MRAIFTRLATAFTCLMLALASAMTAGVAAAAVQTAPTTTAVTLVHPAVPANVIATVGNAETHFYQGLSPARTVLEDAQDQLAEHAPALAYHANFSVGEFRVKPQTVHRLMAYAQSCGYLRLASATPVDYPDLLHRIADCDAGSRWQVAVIMASLKDQHPDLCKRTWADIASDPNAIAKLYSAYAGADTEIARWAADMVPGPVSRERLGYSSETKCYSRVVAP